MSTHNALTAQAEDRLARRDLKHHVPERRVEARIGMGSWKYWSIGLGAGVVLSLMLNSNTMLATHTTAMFATWAAYGIGALVSIILIAISWLRSGEPFTRSDKASWWTHLGGIPGVLAVMVAVISASTLGLVVTISFMLSGQILFGMAVDHWGLFRSPKRRLAPKDFLVTIFVMVGSVLILAFRN